MIVLTTGVFVRLANTWHLNKFCDINLGFPHYTRTLRKTSQPNETRHLHPLTMSTPSDAATPGIDSNTHSPLLPTASDTRRQIIANALVLFPHIVQDHNTSFPNIPIRAEEIFDVCIADVTEQYGSEDAPMYTAKLTHAHKAYPAARMLILSSRAVSTMELALHDLLDRSAHALGVSLDALLPVREGCAEETDGPLAGWALHEETATMGSAYAKEVRQMAEEFDTKEKTDSAQ